MTHTYFKPKDKIYLLALMLTKSSFSSTVKDHNIMKKSKKETPKVKIKNHKV